MIKRTLTFRRPNISVDFFENDDEWEKYKKEKYHDTGMVISEQKETSADGLSVIMTWLYKDLDAFEKFTDDTKNVENFKKRNQYNNSHGVRKIISDAIV